MRRAVKDNRAASQSGEAMPDTKSGEAQHRDKSFREVWQDHLNRVGPPGIDANKWGGKGDAFRHYVSYGYLAKMVGGPLAKLIGDAFEGQPGSPDSVMDENNNRRGVEAASKVDDVTGFALEFMNDVAGGKIKVLDPKTHEPRDTTPNDIEHRNDSRVEDRYRPDRQQADPTDPHEEYDA